MAWNPPSAGQYPQQPPYPPVSSPYQPPSPRRQVLAWVVGAVGLLALLAAGGWLSFQAFTARTPQGGGDGREQGSEQQVITASDRQSQVTVPKSWSRLELHSEAAIEVGDVSQEQYLIVLTEPKADLALDLNGFSESTVSLLTAGLSDERVLPPTHLQISGRPAIQREIYGAIDGIRVVYWHTSVDGPNNYYQVITWTLASKAERDRLKLRQIAMTFREAAR